MSIIPQKPKLLKLPRISQELTQCQMCGYCIEVCEAHSQTPWESVTARGKIYYLNQLDKAGTGAMDSLLGRKATLSPEFVDAMYKCTGCGNCEAVCHAKIELVALWEKVRAWMVKEGVAPLPVHKRLAERIAENANPYGEPKSERDAWWPEDVERATPPDVIFFAGCTGSYRMQFIPKASVRVLDRAGVKVNCLGEDEICCTSPSLRTGVRSLTMDASRTVVTKADGMGAKDMVMSCAGCFKTIATNFGDYYSKTGQNVYHLTQYIDRLISERKLPMNHEFKARVTYHDPCHLGRHSGVYEEPRNILKKIKGLDFVEMERNRQNSRCCGAGGGYKSAFNDFATAIAGERVRDAEAVGAEVIATACPFCVLNLKAGAKKIGSSVKVMDITEILLLVTGAVEKDEKAAAAAKKAVEGAPAAKQVAAPAAAASPQRGAGAGEAASGPSGAQGCGAEPALTPEAIVRRAAWNKGFRCRRNYGADSIPVAFVKSRVAVFVDEDGAPRPLDRKLQCDGWTVLRFKGADVTDGIAEAKAIRSAIRTGLRAERRRARRRRASMPFETLSPEIVEALRARGITEPTEPQADAIPKIAAGANLLLVAPTGIGKTEAAMLPVFDAIFRTKGRKGIRCIYVTPLRALNRDMLRRMEDFGAALGVSVGVRHGDTPQAERNRQSLNPPDVLITTPETVQLLFTGKRLREHLKNVRWFVVDEVHELATVERGAQLAVAMERLAALAGEFQRIGLSATVGDVSEVARFLAGAGREVTVCEHDTHRDFDISVECPDAADDPALLDRLQCDPEMLAVMSRARELIEAGRSTLFFVNTRETAEWIAARYRLWDPSLPIEVHHGSLSKENRTEMEDRFKRGEVRALVCTSSLELGIDVGTTDLVIQFNSPRQVSRMIQRAGRAGHRVGGRIRAKVIATSPDEVAEALVVARRADAKELERKAGRPCPLTVVANQLVAVTMAGRRTRDEAFAVFKRAYPFRDLERRDMDAVLEQLKSIKLVFEDDDGFRRSRRGMDYFYANVSMIPDERSYVIRDIGSRGVVGTLDESFVASFAEERALFIAKGRTWSIVEMREDEILVEEAREIGSVPSWVGSDIPVPFEVAEEVGRLRRTLDLDAYPGDARAKERVRSFVASQGGADVPSDRLVTVETGDRLAIVNSCFGTRVNETLAKVYTALLTARLGESVGISTDPYRIIIELPRNVPAELLMDTVTSVRPGTVEGLIRLTIANSTFLRWRFVYVAKKFGIIDKDADHRFMNFSRLFEMHRGTPAYDEAVDKVIWEDLDVANAERVVAGMADGTIAVRRAGVSPIGMEGITRSKELMQPLRADHAILMAMKKRLEGELLYASCVRCGAQWRVRVGEAPKRPVCPKCGGSMVAALKEYDREKIRLFALKDPSPEDAKEMKRIMRIANLVNEDGRRAFLVLAGRGIGPDSASRILRNSYADEDALLRDVMAAEVLYAKNKRFWD